MKHFLFIAVFVFLCFEKLQEENPFYTLILSEVSQIDSSKYYITYKVNDNYSVSEHVKKSLLNSREIEKLEYNFVLSLETSEKSTQKNCSEKKELRWVFSPPIFVKKNEVLVLASYYAEPKGGGERAYIFQKKCDEWKIIDTISLKDY